MPQIGKITILSTLLLVYLALISACGDANQQVVFDPESSDGHPSGWLPEAHSVAAMADLSSCTECHGAAFDGGISGVACTSCHLGGETSAHPTGWTNIFVAHGPYVLSNGNTECANAACHGTGLGGVAESGPSCTSCHLGDENSIHPLTWTSAFVDHRNYVSSTLGGDATSCANAACHGTDLRGSTGPDCYSCHGKRWSIP